MLSLPFRWLLYIICLFLFLCYLIVWPYSIFYFPELNLQQPKYLIVMKKWNVKIVKKSWIHNFLFQTPVHCHVFPNQKWTNVSPIRARCRLCTVQKWINQQIPKRSGTVFKSSSYFSNYIRKNRKGVIWNLSFHRFQSVFMIWEYNSNKYIIILTNRKNFNPLSNKSHSLEILWK